MNLLEPIQLGPRAAQNRVMFGPHVTNLADDSRALPERWVRYVARRAEGGCAIVVGEGASVHESDWPYERSPLAQLCGAGWQLAATACRDHGSLFVASLDHAGGQGSSAYSQRELWAPSRVPEVNSREVPKWMEADDIAAVVAGFGAAALVAAQADCDGVEINAGQHSLIRQFLSGLTNQRGDEWGTDRLLLARQVIDAVRASLGADRVLGLRLSCDELAPWAGITPDAAPSIAAQLAACGLDYLVVVRGAIFSIEKTRPDFHEPTGFNIDVCRSVRDAVQQSSPATKVILQGSVVDWGQAEWALGDGVCDAVEMTRAQIADPSLVSKLANDQAAQIRPCIRCNQSCQVRDARNPIVSCVGEPTSGRETEDPDWYQRSRHPRNVVVVGGGPAGLETARVAALRGHSVRIVERSARLGGVASVAGPALPLVDWLIAECERNGVSIELNTAADQQLASRPNEVVVQATGSLPGVRTYAVHSSEMVLDVLLAIADSSALPSEGQIVLFDPIGGPIAVALAEQLGERAVLITQDNIAGNELSRTGDLAPANVRLAQRGVHIERRSLLREVHQGHVVVEDRFTAERRDIACAAVVDCGFRLPTEPLPGAQLQAGDCVAPRTMYEAILEGRRAALVIDNV